jgi:hypothetical protein
LDWIYNGSHGPKQLSNFSGIQMFLVFGQPVFNNHSLIFGSKLNFGLFFIPILALTVCFQHPLFPMHGKILQKKLNDFHPEII